MAVGTSCRIQGTLPSPTSGFVGREAELARVRELLRRWRRADAEAAVAMAATFSDLATAGSRSAAS